MKRIFAIIVVVVLVTGAAYSQKSPSKHHRQPDVTTLVSNLSPIQKKRLETLSSESQERTRKLRQDQKALRDSIHTYIKLPDDHSAILFPMFEREAWFQAEISKEYYRTRLQIDEILTAEQREELQQNLKKQQSSKPQRKK